MNHNAPFDLSEWQNKVAVVTGASSGIGRAVAQALTMSGLRVAGVARRKKALAALAEKLGGRSDAFFSFPADLREIDKIPTLFEDIRNRLGRLDVLINSAGLGYDAPLLSGSSARWREMLEVNVLALCACSREAVAAMHAQGDSGYIIHISSLSGHRVPPAGGVYTATKHAVAALTEALRLELRAAGSNVRVSALSPGFVETEFASNFHQSKEKAAAVYDRYPCLQSADIARAVMFLLSQPQHVQYHDLLVRPTKQPT